MGKDHLDQSHQPPDFPEPTIWTLTIDEIGENIDRLKAPVLDQEIPAELIELHQKASRAQANFNQVTVHANLIKDLIYQFWGVNLKFLSEKSGQTTDKIRRLLNHANLTLRGEYGIEIITRNGIAILVNAKDKIIRIYQPGRGENYRTYAGKIIEKVDPKPYQFSPGGPKIILDEENPRIPVEKRRSPPPRIFQKKIDALTEKLKEYSERITDLIVENSELRKEPTRLQREIDRLRAKLEKAQHGPSFLQREVEKLKERLENLRINRGNHPQTLQPEIVQDRTIYNSLEQLPPPPYSPKLTKEEIERNIEILTEKDPEATDVPNTAETVPWIGGLIIDAHAEASKDSIDKDFFTEDERDLLKILINQYHGVRFGKIAGLTGFPQEKIEQITAQLNEKFHDFQRIFKITIQNGIAILTLVTGNIFLLKPKPKS